LKPAISLLVCLLLTAAAWSQSDSAALDHVLDQMDSAAKTFHTAQANFTVEIFDPVLKEITDTQNGKISFQRHGKEVEMASDFAEPKQFALYTNGKAQVYNPRTDTVNEYKADKNRAQLEAFLLLGFGGGGHDLLTTYNVKYQSSEAMGGVTAAKLELTPKSQELRNNIARILLWIDLPRGVSVQQQMFFADGGNRLAKYSDIHINQKLPEGTFKLKTTGKTKFISPQS
jgi:outer membrane lipoprotein-sorting protein